jgi:poly(A) polymerase
VFGRPFKLSRIFFNTQSEATDIGGDASADSQVNEPAAAHSGVADADTAAPSASQDGDSSQGDPFRAGSSSEDNLPPSGQEGANKLPDPRDRAERQDLGGREDADQNYRRRGHDRSSRRNSGRGSSDRNDYQRPDRDSETDDLSSDPTAEQLIKGLVGSPKILNRDEHKISRKLIDPDALKVLYRLNRSGFLAFLVGGSVRDLLLGKQPKDFDIGTSARPDQVRSLFRNSRTIGRRFKISHVYFRGNHILEVTTFRQGTVVSEDSTDDKTPGILQPDNVFGDPETDAFRRDLTINGLFYDVGTLSVIDYVGGVQDLNDGIIRMIGDPYVRVQEDPVRMIRAIRHAARTGFKIEEKTYDAIVTHKSLIEVCPPARVLEELLREFRSGSLFRSLKMLHETGLLKLLIPTLAETVDAEGQTAWDRLEMVLSHLDDIATAGVGLSPSMLFISVLVGNLPPSVFEGDKEILKVYWQTDPQFSNSADLGTQSEQSGSSEVDDDEEAFGNEDADDSEEEDSIDSAVSRVVGNGPELSQLLSESVRKILRRQIDELFSKLTLSRHEREMMETYLVNRLKMFAVARGIANPQLEGGVSMNNLMLILGLTSLQNPSAHDCFTFWQERMQSRRGQNFTGERPRGGGRRRRRRRRR